jgi:hypothetical protein
VVKSKWSVEEDGILREAVKKYGESNWQTVANMLEGRTGQQCLHRWTKTVNPVIKRGRWSAEEDKMLLAAVKAYGKDSFCFICCLKLLSQVKEIG